jgi:hypothetical protein
MLILGVYYRVAGDFELICDLETVSTEACGWLLGSFLKGTFEEVGTIDEFTMGSIKIWRAAMSSRHEVECGATGRPAECVEVRMVERDSSVDSTIACEGVAVVAIQDADAKRERTESVLRCEVITVVAIEDVDLG